VAGRYKITGTSGANTIKTYGGNDKVYGGAGNDKIYLGNGNDYVKVGGGKESFYGGSGSDYISYYASGGGVRLDLATNTASGGWAVNDVVNGFESATGSKTGGDTLFGTSGSNTFKSYGGADSLYGRGGADKLYGGSGADLLNGGSGNDALYGGGDADSFHFDHGSDQTIIKDFENNVDTIQLNGFGFADAAEALTYATNTGGDVVFDFGGGDTLIVEDTSKGYLTNDLEVT